MPLLAIHTETGELSSPLLVTGIWHLATNDYPGTQTPPTKLYPSTHLVMTQLPSEQYPALALLAVLQLLPHAPQLAGSKFASLHTPPHSICGNTQFGVHLPALQVSPALHFTPCNEPVHAPLAPQ